VKKAAKQRRSQATVYIIAGPNGAGKTTFAMKFLPQISESTLIK